jgi:hypothetical protein
MKNIIVKVSVILLAQLLALIGLFTTVEPAAAATSSSGVYYVL